MGSAGWMIKPYRVTGASSAFVTLMFGIVLLSVAPGALSPSG
jgi:hypothetical protein